MTEKEEIFQKEEAFVEYLRRRFKESGDYQLAALYVLEECGWEGR